MRRRQHDVLRHHHAAAPPLLAGDDHGVALHGAVGDIGADEGVGSTDDKACASRITVTARIVFCISPIPPLDA